MNDGFLASAAKSKEREVVQVGQVEVFIGVPRFALLVVEVFNILCFVFTLKKIVDSYIRSGHVVDKQCKPKVILL